jgi:CRISPR/Cas system-associated exonuclease Cas4 (RecB family)
LTNKPKLTGTLEKILALRGDDDGSWLVNELDRVLETPQVEDRGAGWFHASALDHPCDRYIGYQYAGVRYKQIIPAQTKKRFLFGLMYEEMVEKRLKEAGILIAAQKQFEIPEHKIRLTPDFIVEHPIHHYPFILETKTTNSNYFKQYKDTPDAKHVDRTVFYMGATGIHRGVILYSNKDTHKEVPHILTYDETAYLTRAARADNIRATVEANQLPEKTILPKGGCLVCPFFRICTDEVKPLDAPKMLKGVHTLS